MLRDRVSAPATIALCVVAACQSATRDDASGFNSGPAGTSGDAESGSTSEAATSGPLLDALGDGGITGPGCSRVDFLFVIDSSGSMLDEQANLQASVPGFIHEIDQVLRLQDYRVMVVETTAAGAGCEGTLGAGRATDATGVDCGLGEQRYFDSNLHDLGTTFPCLANVGVEGDGDERTMDALISAVTTQSEPGGCNEGFVRDDAILVVTVITDEEDGPGDEQPLPSILPPYEYGCGGVDDDPNSSGDPSAWFDGVVAAKNGTETAVVLLGLIGDCDVGDCEPVVLGGGDGSVVTGSEPAPRIRELVQSFTHGRTAPICAPDYAPFFSDAVAVVNTACEEFTPQG